MNANAYPVHSGLDRYNGAPILIAASSERGARRAAETAEAAGFSVFSIPLEAVLQRFEQQGSAAAFWLELEDDPGPALDQILDRINSEVGAGRFPAVIAVPNALIDPIATRICHPDIEVVVDGTPSDRAAALAMATVRGQYKNNGVNEDVAGELSAARLRQLSDDVSRIAATLARLSVAPGIAPAGQPATTAQAGQAPAVSLDTVRQVIRARQLRARFFEEELFADPAWDMLLDLFQAEIAEHRVAVSSLCLAAAVPATTALRWIKRMTDVGLFKRCADPHDGRRVFVKLSSSASDSLRRYFNEFGKAAVV